MKHLILARHAKSSWANIMLADIDRPLNKRGKRDAPFMAKQVKSLIKKIDIFLVSPAKRARKTAKHFYKYYPKSEWRIEQDIYEATPDTLEDLIYSLDDDMDTAILFGHNPGFTYLINRYAKEPLYNLPTCGVAVIECSENMWSRFHPSSSEMTELIYPKQFFPK